MVATSAFELGIDKADIRYVLHFQSPASLEQYAGGGPGGRDGFKANCILLYDGSDRAIHGLLLARGRVPDQLYKLTTRSRIGRARERSRTSKRSPCRRSSDRVSRAVLTKLEEAGLVRWEGEQIRLAGSAETLEEDARALAGQFETLRRQDVRRLDSIGEYAQSTECRAVFLRQYFGEPDDEPCTLCDICRGSPERPESFFDPLVRPDRGGPRRSGRRPQQQGRRGRGRNEGRPRRERTPRPSAVPAAIAAAAEPFNPLDLEDAPGDAPFATAPSDGAGRPRRRRGRRGGRRRRGRRGGEDESPPPAAPLD
jgi:hypothetical protein